MLNDSPEVVSIADLKNSLNIEKTKNRIVNQTVGEMLACNLELRSNLVLAEQRNIENAMEIDRLLKEIDRLERVVKVLDIETVNLRNNLGMKNPTIEDSVDGA